MFERESIEENYLDTNEFAMAIRIKRTTLHRWMCQGRLKATKGKDYIQYGSGRGARIYFKSDFLKRYLANPEKYLQKIVA